MKYRMTVTIEVEEWEKLPSAVIAMGHSMQFLNFDEVKVGMNDQAGHGSEVFFGMKVEEVKEEEAVDEEGI